MPARPSAFSHLLAPGLRKVYWEKYKALPLEYPQVFNVGSSKRAYEEDIEISSLGMAVPKPVGAPIVYDLPYEGKVKRYTHVAFGLGFRVTREMYDDDLYGIMRRMSQALAKSMKVTQEVYAWNIFNHAFNPAYPGPDGKPLCASNHPDIAGHAGSGPFANRPAVDADLSPASLQSAISAFETMTDDRGIPLVIRPKLLLVHPNNKWAARELLESEYKPYTGDNEINVLADEGLKYMICHYFTDEDMYFLVAGKDDHYLNYFWRVRPEFGHDDDFDTMDAKYRSYERFSTGFSGWRGVWGSPGA